MKLELVILQTTVETKIASTQKSYDEEVTQLRHNKYTKKRNDASSWKISELNNIIVSLTNKVNSIEVLNESLQKSISENTVTFQKFKEKFNTKEKRI